MQYATQVLSFCAVKYRPLKRQIQGSFGLLNIQLAEPWSPYCLKLKIVGSKQNPRDPWEPSREGQHLDIIAEALVPARRIQDSITILGQGTSLWLHRGDQTVALLEGEGIQPCLMPDGSNRLSGDRLLHRIISPKILGVETVEYAVEERFREQLDREAITV